MKDLAITCAVLFAMAFSVVGCEQQTMSAPICCEFANGCSGTQTADQCTRIGGTPHAGQACNTTTNTDPPPEVIYECK